MSVDPSSFSASSPSWPEGLAPHVAALLEGIRQAAYPPIYQLPVEQARQVYETSISVMSLPAVEMARVEDLTLSDAAAQPMRARLWAPTTAGGLPVLLYLHGGGFVVGGIATCENMCRRIASLSGAAVLAVEYRLAPEHRFPAAVEDSFAALRWLHEQGAGLGLDPRRLAVGGDSAGGTLTATTALMARDAGIALAAQLMFYPSVQISQPTESFKRYADRLLLSKELMAWFEQNYRDAQGTTDWRREPLKADLRGVAPAWIGLAQCDALADDGRLYAEALRRAGVPVQLQEWPGMIHDFINMERMVPEAADAHAAFARALKTAFER
jgi:acetyl esterase